ARRRGLGARRRPAQRAAAQTPGLKLLRVAELQLGIETADAGQHLLDQIDVRIGPGCLDVFRGRAQGRNIEIDKVVAYLQDLYAGGMLDKLPVVRNIKLGTYQYSQFSHGRLR